MGKLYIIATPIGNLGDMTFRAVEMLKQCDIIACEDTRTSQVLFDKFDIKAQLVSYHDKNELIQAEWLAEQVEKGCNVGVVCDAGTPTISDPGFRVVKLCRNRGLNVIPIPGPSAMIAALSVSGLPSNAFLFLGFPGHKDSTRVNILKKYCDLSVTLIFYESCYRVEKFLKNIIDICGEARVISVAKEITKIHENYFSGKAIDALRWLNNTSIKGEFVILVAPSDFSL